jgi:hypothetical protein
MAGLDPATQPSRGSARENENRFGLRAESFARTDVRALGGRVKPGHDES